MPGARGQRSERGPERTRALGGCTRDLAHKYYQEQYQLNGGKGNRYVTGSDAAGMTMGVYNTKGLPLYTYLHQPLHPWYATADNLFQEPSGARSSTTSSSSRRPRRYSRTPQRRLRRRPALGRRERDAGEHAAVHVAVGRCARPGLTASCNPPSNRGPTPPGITCGDFAVNTVQPLYQPYQPGTPDVRRLPPQTNPTIGDRLSAAGVDWAWYSGGWSNANGDVGGPGWTNG